MSRADVVGVLVEQTGATGNGWSMAEHADLASYTHGSSRSCNSIAGPCRTLSTANPADTLTLARPRPPLHHAGLR